MRSARGICAGLLLAIVPGLAGADTTGAGSSYCSPAAFAAPAAKPFGTLDVPLRCRPLRVVAPGGVLSLALARTQIERERGLMFVRDVPMGTGMLFAFARTDVHDFWMKNTLVPLDMVFVDERGIVTTVAPSVPASTLETPDDRVADREGLARYVIELRAGDAAALGIRSGLKLIVPPIDGVE